ncbi:MAG: hypothetical protein GXO68_04160 [Crenarchaeota archaeon]|nr:hypothetical protein [Thermoproteota archaeon]
MCRILIAKASTQTGVGLLEKLVDLHLKASENDHLLASLTGGDGRHCHGYGYLLLVDYGNGWTLHYTRFDTADYIKDYEKACKANLARMESESKHLRSILEGAKRAILLLHSRRASRGMPRGTLNAHPFAANIARPRENGELFLIHNGSVHSEPLAKDLGLDPDSYTDSHLLTLWIATKMEKGLTLRESLQEAIRFTKRAFVVGVVYIGPTGVDVLAVSHLPADLDEKRIAYYKPYLVNASGIRAVVSPTIIDLAAEKGMAIEPRFFNGILEI